MVKTSDEIKRHFKQTVATKFAGFEPIKAPVPSLKAQILAVIDRPISKQKPLRGAFMSMTECGLQFSNLWEFVISPQQARLTNALNGEGLTLANIQEVALWAAKQGFQQTQIDMLSQEAGGYE